MNNTIVLATHNQGKVSELQQLFTPFSYDIKSLAEFSIGDIVEDGKSFVENALIKARTVAKATGLPAIGDDSGLLVAALNGEPGLYSARYAGEHGNASANNQKLLSVLADVDTAKRQAYFHCTMVYVSDAEDECPLVAQGNWHGQIVNEPSGVDGFGYDPIFYLPELKCTAAELDKEKKNLLSHRGQALRQLMSLLTTRA